MHSLILGLHITASLVLIGFILIQHGKGADAGAAAFGGGGGASASLFGSQGSASFLSRSSGVLAAIFFITSLSLAYFGGSAHKAKSVTQSVTVEQPAGKAKTPADLPDIP